MGLIKIKAQFSGEIDESPKTLNAYRHDASIFDITPKAIIFPKTAEDIEVLMRWATAEKQKDSSVSLTARSAGTDMSGGAVNDSVIVDFTRYCNKIIEIHENDGHMQDQKKSALLHAVAGYAVTQPGVYYRDFEAETLKHNLLMPTFPASRGICAMGGIMANNSGGEKSLSYGKSIKFIEEIWAVMTDGNEYHFGPLTESELEAKMRQQNFEGNLYRKVFRLINQNYEAIKQAKPDVTKNSAGYNLWDVWDKKIFNLAKLLVGSQGTLGFITKGKFNLVRPHNKSEMLVMFLNGLEDLGEIVNTVMQHRPETFESFDDHTLDLAVKFMPAMLKKMSRGTGSAFGGIVKMIRLGWEFIPEMWMTISGGLPKLILLAEFTGDDEEEVVMRMKKAQAEVEKLYRLKTHVTKNVHEEEKYWTVRRESFNLLRSKIKDKHTAPFIDDFCVHPKDLPEFLPRLDAIFKQYPTLIYTIAGHAGDANFHIIPLMDFTKEDQIAIIPKLSHEVYDLVLEYHGSITAEHNDGLVRGPFLEKMYGDKIFELFKEVKNIFDPLNILNPHKKTDATEEYLVSHIRRD